MFCPSSYNSKNQLSFFFSRFFHAVLDGILNLEPL